ncbi:hypothetical protein ACGFT2_23755 [Streptomyces sp. NPDC048514]|uniref:hypothetical protein n=1 Tax=Streptomyces sp. NPDC048514 TaxID=3365564 RepID=UPI00371CE323
MTGRPSTDRATSDLLLADRMRRQGPATRAEPGRVKVMAALLGLATAACYDVFDDPGMAPICVAAAIQLGHFWAVRTRRGSAALGYASTGLRDLPAAYTAVMLAAGAALIAAEGVGLRLTRGYLNAHVPAWHTLAMLVLIAVAFALAPLERRGRERLATRTHKQGSK